MHINLLLYLYCVSTAAVVQLKPNGSLCFNDTLYLSPLFQVQDVYSNVYDGLSKPQNTVGNECGIVVNSADISHHGKWTCKVFVVGNSLRGSKNVVVTSKHIRLPRSFVSLN